MITFELNVCKYSFYNKSVLLKFIISARIQKYNMFPPSSVDKYYKTLEIDPFMIDKKGNYLNEKMDKSIKIRKL